MRAMFCIPLVFAVGASIIAGCAAESPAATTGAWDDRIEEVHLNATTDFEREILSDGIITRAEYEEINRGLVTCMSDAGYQLTLIEQGGYYVYSVPYSDEANATLMHCQDAGGAILAGLYVDMLTNPNNIDHDELMLQCLKREGLLPETFTVDEYRAGNSTVTLESYENGKMTMSDPSPWSLPFSPDEPGFDACNINPSVGTVK